MSKKKRTAIIAAVSTLLAAFTVWNLVDFCQSERHSTVAYLAIIFNVGAIIELVRLLWREVKYRAEH